VWLKPTESWQTIHYASASFSPDPNFYIKTKKVK
jgi:hypothetical protein